jgi:sugar phosphate isomerase/epimerase
MAGLSRRQFIAAGAATGIGALGLDLMANPLGMPIGCQTYPVRMNLQTDFPGTMKMLTDAGFTAIELCSPAGYREFNGLAKYSGKELKKTLNDMGITCQSCHFGLRELRTNQAERIQWASDMGMTQMAVASLSGPKNPTMDDVKKAADEYNKFGEQARKANIWQTLHNENFETSMVGDRRVYDVLFELLDPKLVKFQFQVSTIEQGFDAAEYFNKYPGRFISMHCQGWDMNAKKQVAIGSAQDSLDWKKIFTAAKTGGIQNYFIEMAYDLMKPSVPYVKSLQV